MDLLRKEERKALLEALRAACPETPDLIWVATLLRSKRRKLWRELWQVEGRMPQKSKARMRVWFAWLLRGFCVDSAWVLRWFCVRSAWVLHGFRVGLAWILHGTCVGYARFALGFCMGSPLVLLGFCGCLH
jgi:hypothetical protein